MTDRKTLISMLEDLSINLAASVIYEFGKAPINAADKTEAVQLARKRLRITNELHDFPDRYLEALVELRFEEKPRLVLDFFRAKEIMESFYAYYYGPVEVRGNDRAHAVALNRCVTFLELKYPDTPTTIKISEEVDYFWQIFRQKVQESRTLKEVEINQKLDELKTMTANETALLRELMDWLRQKNIEQIEVGGKVMTLGNAQAQEVLLEKAEKIYKIGKIGTAFFDGVHHHYSDKKLPRLLTTPPFNSHHFIGRGEDLERIEADYQQNNRLLLLVNGEGGIGKTTLAAKYWYTHEARYNYLAWLYAEAGIGSALLTLKEVLGVAFEPGDNISTQMQRMAHALSNLEAPCLLVLDNANDAADLEKYYTLLNQLSNCHILLTSRVRKLADMRVHAVQPLSEADTLQLFRTYYSKLAEAELPLLQDILRAVGYNTLVTEVLAKNMAAINRYSLRYTLADLLADLQEKGLLALKNKTVQVVYGSDTLREAQPTEIIAAMYDLAALHDAERYLLSNLAVLPAESIPFTLLATLLATDADTLEGPLYSLETKGWIEHENPDDSSFKISPVIQEVTKAKNADCLLADCRSLVNTLQTGLDEDNRHTDNYRQANVFARMGAAVIQAISIPNLDLVILCQNIGNYYQDTSNLSGMMQTYQKMVDIQTALCTAEPDNADFKKNLSISYAKLGETYLDLGDLNRALTFFEDGTKLFEALNEDYPQNLEYKHNLAISYERLGETFSHLGDLNKALTFFEQFNDLKKVLHEAYPQNMDIKNNLAISYERLGRIYRALGDSPRALTLFEKETELVEALCKAHPQNAWYKNALAISYSELGETHRTLGVLPQALIFFEQYRALLHE